MSTADACADTASTGTNHINWSITTSAPTTSQVIGVLAALVFAAIILLLQVGSASDPVRHRYSVRALNTLVYVFFILMLSSFFFSVIAGSLINRVAFAEGIYAAALFATAAVGTFLSICWLFAAHRIGSEQLFLAKAITVIVVVAAWTHTTLTLFYVVLAVERPQ